MSREIRLPSYGIVITLGEVDPETPDAYVLQSSKIESDLLNDVDPAGLEDRALSAALNAIESIVLAHAVAGIDVATPAYLEGLETAVDAVFAQYD